MTALVKYPAKGMTLLQSIASVYTALAGVRSIDISGYKTLTMPTESLDASSPVKTKQSNGFADPPTIKASGFYDPAHATYTAFEGLMPAATVTNFKVTFPDAAPTSRIYSGVGFAINIKGEVGNALMADIEIETSGPIT